MAYFLKKTKINERVFLQISETTYNKITKKSSNRCYKKLGYLDSLISDSMPDPIAYYGEEVKKLNKKRNEQIEKEKIARIGEDPTRNIGYFLVKDMYNTLGIEKELNPFKYMVDFSYPISSLVEALTYSRIVMPCSKLKTYNEVFPYLYEDYDFSLDQIYYGLEFIGTYYSRFIEAIKYCIDKT